ncbi:MAG: SWIM zinc finger family protein [Verrucomicrobia bacterium]|nr:SWIM zinc finger family protein [Verrucomicrobiota bacterium]
MSWGWRPYVPVRERRRSADAALKCMLGKDESPQPIRAFSSRKMALTFWGEAWCEHLESMGDYANRLPRGRTYVRNGSVVHLHIDTGKITALVSGSDLYKIEITVSPLGKARWKKFKGDCAGQVATLLDLLRGKVSDAVLKRIIDLDEGLFPSTREIKLSCSCPDWAVMCKHVAATLYGVGARLDDSPELFFRLRGVDHLELIQSAAIDSLDGTLPDHEEQLNDSDLSGIFGIDFSDVPALPEPRKSAKKRKTPKNAKVKTTSAAKKRAGRQSKGR